MAKNKDTHITVEVPKELWVDFTGIIYTAVQHITLTEENIEIMNFLRSVVGKSLRDGEILVVDGKIIAKKDL